MPAASASACLIRIRIVGREVDDGLDPEGLQVGEVAFPGLGATVELGVDAAEVVDLNRRKRCGARAGVVSGWRRYGWACGDE